MLPVKNLDLVIALLQAQGKLGPGRTFFVGNGTAQHGQIAASDANSGLNVKEPMATIDGATNNCTAGRGDNVVVLPGHTESITAAGGITSDVAGVTYYALGPVAPVITFATSTAATWVVSAADVRILGDWRFTLTIDELVVAFPVTGPRFHMQGCHCIVASSTAQCVQWMTLSAAADEATIEDCEFWGDTDNGTSNLEVLSVAAVVGLTLRRCNMDIIGAAGVGPVHFTGAATNVLIEDCNFANRVASATACIDCDALAVVGEHRRCSFVLGTIATAGSGITPVVAASGFFSSYQSGVINDQNESDAIVGSAST